MLGYFSHPLQTDLLKRKHLILGCGHNLKCGTPHPLVTFVTINEDASTQPDFVCDAHNIELVFKLCAHYDKFDTIIYERIPVPANFNPLLLKDILSSRGRLIFIGPSLQTMLRRLSVGQCLLIMPEIAVTILSTTQPNLVFDAVTKSYLESVSKKKNIEKEFTLIEVTDDLKQRAENLLELHQMHIPKLNFFYLYFDHVLIEKANPKPITLQEIHDIGKEYHPGSIRLYAGGMTKGMLQLANFFSRFSDIPKTEPLKINELCDLLGIILQREERHFLGSHVLNYFDPTRSFNGSTTNVFRKMAVRILNYFISNEIVFNELKFFVGLNKLRIT